MPVEERLRAAFADQVAEVRPDVEQRLDAVHSRLSRRRAIVWSSSLAAVVALVLGVALLMPPDVPDPRPAAPPDTSRVSEAGKTVPLGRYTREVTRREALDLGFRPAEVRWLFGGGRTARVEMRFRDAEPSENAWVLTFVDDQGSRQGRDGGSYFYGGRGELTISSRWIDCLGCTYRFGWQVDGRRLTLQALPDTEPWPVVELLQADPWVRTSP
jgi:hypothetical protein